MAGEVDHRPVGLGGALPELGKGRSHRGMAEIVVFANLGEADAAQRSRDEPRILRGGLRGFGAGVGGYGKYKRDPPLVGSERLGSQRQQQWQEQKPT